MTNLHTVAITGTPDKPKIEFTCHGDRTSECHQYPDCQCDSWDSRHEHPSVAHDECWMKGWFDNDGIDPMTETLGECDYVPGMSGPIATSFCWDYIEWEFVNEGETPDDSDDLAHPEDPDTARSWAIADRDGVL